MIRSSRRRVLAALSLALLVAGLVVLLRPAAEPPPTPAAQPPKETPRSVAPRPRAPRSEAPVDETPPAKSRFDVDYEGIHGTPTPPADVKEGASRLRGVELSVIDGSTGRPMPDVVVRGAEEGSAAPSKLLVDDKGKAEFAARVEHPEGFGGLEVFTWHGPVASRAASVRIVIPVYPLGDVALRFVNEAGAPVVGVKEIRATARNPWNNREESVTLRASPSDGAGATTLRMPRIPFHEFALSATKRLTPGDEDVIFPDDDDASRPAAALWLSATFVVKPTDFGAPTRTVVLVKRRPRGGRGQGGGGGSSCGPDQEPEGAKAPLVVRLFHGDERPAALVTVALEDGSYLRAQSDGAGVARFPELTVGERPFLAFAHGFRPTPFRAKVGDDAMIDVHETPARAVDVIVEDAEGRRVPAACVTARCASVIGPDGVETSVGGWCTVAQLDGDVELATPRTGPDGVVRLQEPAGRIDYRAELGGALVEESSSADVVRIVIKAPK